MCIVIAVHCAWLSMLTLPGPIFLYLISQRGCYTICKEFTWRMRSSAYVEFFHICRRVVICIEERELSAMTAYYRNLCCLNQYFIYWVGFECEAFRNITGYPKRSRSLPNIFVIPFPFLSWFPFVIRSFMATAFQRKCFRRRGKGCRRAEKSQIDGEREGKKSTHTLLEEIWGM